MAARLLAEDCPLPPLPAVWCCLRSLDLHRPRQVGGLIESLWVRRVRCGWREERAQRLNLSAWLTA
eukprot:COSAG02_NODE_57737_length_279_cov_1.283333_1_plen_65_part_01